MGVNSNNLRKIILENQIVKGLDIDKDLVPNLTEQEKISNEKKQEYIEKINNKIENFINPISLNELKILFKKTFEFEESKKLIVTKDNAPIYDLIARYFANDESFNKTKITENIPSLEKGLLLIGGVGCGKTSIMNTYHKIGYKRLPCNLLWFSKNSCLSVVQEFEELNDNDIRQREDFNDKYNNTKKMYFDDFGSENDASKFGKRNLMKEILEERYSNKKVTHITTNLTLDEINKKYGFRIFDRLQEMFNIIIINGKSYRK